MGYNGALAIHHSNVSLGSALKLNAIISAFLKNLKETEEGCDLSWFQTTTWDELGTYFYNTTIGEDHEGCECQEMYNKLVFGFLESLKNKIADKNTPLYHADPQQTARWSSRDPL
jgi:hypothetical protein